MPDTDLWGYADLHCHPMAHLAFGGVAALAQPPRFGEGAGLFWGLPFHPGEPRDANGVAIPSRLSLPCCNASHNITLDALSGAILADTHHGCGATEYPDWPRHDTTLHQQMHEHSIRRAFESGLRLMCALAVNAQILGYLTIRNNLTLISDKNAILQQIFSMQELAARHSSWMKVVLSPAEARATIAEGKLAVVLGIEVDTLSGTEGDLPARMFRSPETAEQDCSDDQIRRVVQQWFDKGVRMITPIHLTDNAFGGCGIYNDLFCISNDYLFRQDRDIAGRFYEIDRSQDAPLGGVTYLLGKDPHGNLYRNSWPNFPVSRYEVRRDGHINHFGLTPRGETLLKAMMQRGMLIDVDHMSIHSRAGALGLAEEEEYAVISSHSSCRSLAITRAAGSNDMTGVTDEAMLADDDVRLIIQLGGMVAPITHIRKTNGQQHAQMRAPVVAAGRDTSNNWANTYMHMLDLVGSAGGSAIHVALGTDFNGLAQQSGGRFENGQPPVGDRPLAYGRDLLRFSQLAIDRSSFGTKQFDFNGEGMVHYGMLPDFLTDVENQLIRPDLMASFYRSAQGFIETWEKCLAAAAQVDP